MSILSSVLLMIAGLALTLFLLALVPAPPQAFTDSVAYVWGLLQGLEAVFPVSTFIIIVGVIVQIELIIFQLRAVRWLWVRLRGGGGE